MTGRKSKEVYGHIYIIRNDINNKIYIGQVIASKEFDKRYPYKSDCPIEKVYYYHNYRKRNNQSYNDYLLKSIVKYGFENWTIDEVFDIAYSKKELDKLEKLYIAIYSSNSKEFGYNQTSGGSSGKLNEEARRKISESKLGEKHPLFGKKIPEEWRKKLGESRRGEKNHMYGKKGELCPSFGIKRSDEFKENVSKTHKGKIVSEETRKKLRENHKDNTRGKHPLAKKIICITNGKIFDCIKDGAEYYNINKGTFTQYVRESRPIGFSENGTKLEWMYYEEYLKSNSINKECLYE